MADDPTLDLRVILNAIELELLHTVCEWVEDTAEDMRRRLEETWPDAPPEHPYARGRSASLFRVALDPDRLGATVTNEAAYSGYVEKGYTRYGGARSARPYQSRGGRDYAATVVAETADEWIGDLEQRLEREVTRG